MSEPRSQPQALADALARAGFLLELLDRLPDLVAFVKDAEGRYLAASEPLVRRLGLRRREEVLGRTARDLFPAPLGDRYLAQDLAVVRGGTPIVNLLELHLYPGGREGWCLTTKVPVRGDGGGVVGLAGTSRDVAVPDAGGEPVDRLAEALQQLRQGFARPLRIEALARRAGLSPYQFNLRVRRLFGLSPAKLLVQTRIDAARRMLQEERASVAEIAQACGYSDQSAFTRQFRAVAGMPPARYRELQRRSGERG